MAAIETLSHSVRPRVVGAYLGQLMLIVGLLSIPPLLFALINTEWSYAAGHAIEMATLLGGGWILFRGESSIDIQTNEALVVVTLIFLITPLIFAVPMLTKVGFSDAIFEAVSGITTTGLSTFATVEDKPRSLLFTAAWLQWLGGLGIMVFSFALLFGQGIGAKRLTAVLGEQQNVYGGTRAYAGVVVRVYVGLTVGGIAALWIAGANWFVAVTLTLASVSTGGYSPLNASIGSLDDAIQAIVILLCLFGAVAPSIFYEAAHGRWRVVLRDFELRALVIACMVVSALLLLRWWIQEHPGAYIGSMDLVITALSAQTTAGFSAVQISNLDTFSKLVLIVAMGLGGGVGSSAGGIKLLRLIVFIKVVQLVILKTRLTPHAVAPTQIIVREWADHELIRLLLIILLFVGVVALSWLVFLWFGHDPLDSLFEVVSATGTVGLSTGLTSGGLESPLKAILCLDMLLGRLEILPILVLLAPRTWIGPRQSSAPSQKAKTP